MNLSEYIKYKANKYKLESNPLFQNADRSATYKSCLPENLDKVGTEKNDFQAYVVSLAQITNRGSRTIYKILKEQYPNGLPNTYKNFPTNKIPDRSTIERWLCDATYSQRYRESP